MALITEKYLVIKAYENCAKNSLYDLSTLLIKIQHHVDDGDFEQEEVQHIIDTIVNKI